MRFQRIVILGNGKIAVDCLYELLNYVDKTNIFVIEVIRKAKTYRMPYKKEGKIK